MDSVATFNIPDEIVEEFNNILYVDDEASNLRVFDSVFCRYYNVFTANNGQTAINLLREHDIHMIITDQKMPEMTGTDLLEQTLQEFPDIIRIILTGFADIQAIIKAINKCSIYKYITKPYENSEMREIIDKGLEIYNMREKKYTGTPLFSEKQIHSAVTSNIEPKELDPNLSEMILDDVKPSKEYYELFVEHVISYQYKQKSPLYFKDFVVHSDEDSTKIYHISYKLEESNNNSLVYLHLKHKLREILEVNDNNLSLIDLLTDLEEFYLKRDSNVSMSSVNLVSYNWDTLEFRYLTKNKQLRLYAVNDRLEELSTSQLNNYADGYTLHGRNNLEKFMIYNWDYCLRKDIPESDFSHNVNQIISNAINLPFDLQESQISKGINSMAKDFNDFVLSGIYLND